VLTLADIQPAIPAGARVIAIAGIRGTGKTTLANEFGWPVIHADDYIIAPHQDRPRTLIQACLAIQVSRYVIEGCEVGRVLRTGDREGTWHPDFIIWRQPERPLKGWDKGVQTIFAPGPYWEDTLLFSGV
jgi:hypothetical protein